jgi:hypothetical protein
MPLPAPAASIAREPLHTRSIAIQAYRRADGLMDVEARLTDVKAHDFPLASGTRPAGEAVHDMWVRITVNRDYDVVDAVTATDSMPYAGECNRINPDYRAMVGMNLKRGFRKAVLERFGEIRGCTHLTELIGLLPTATIQAFAGERRENIAATKGKPFQLDRCHALDTRGPAVAQYYPAWHRKDETRTDGHD